MPSPIQQYLDRCLEPRFQLREKDKLFQRRWVLAEMTPFNLPKGGPKLAVRIPSTCYQLSEHRFCWMLTDNDFIAEMGKTFDLSHVLQVVERKVGEQLAIEAESYGLSLYTSAPSLLKVKGGRDSQIGVEFSQLRTHPAYDEKRHGPLDSNLFLSMMEATCELREELKRRDAENIEYENLILLWHFMRIWHSTRPDSKAMSKADSEMAAIFYDDWMERSHTLGDLEGNTWVYWNGDNYATPFMARHVNQAYVATDDGRFGEVADGMFQDTANIGIARHCS